MGVATFVYASWAARFPEFRTTVDESAADALFSEAGLYLDNTNASPVADVTVRTTYLWYVTAHLAQLYYGSSLQANNQMVGRISQAAEGTVNFTLTTPDSLGQEAWFLQTKYGAMYWAATARYRQFRYRSSPRRPVVPF